MNNALVAVAQGIADNLRRFQPSDERFPDLTRTEASHYKATRRVIERLDVAVQLHTEKLLSDDELGTEIFEAHLDILNETINYTQELEIEKRRSVAAASLGSAKSDSKSATSRENGKKGGRPRKATE